MHGPNFLSLEFILDLWERITYLNLRIHTESIKGRNRNCFQNSLERASPFLFLLMLSPPLTQCLQVLHAWVTPNYHVFSEFDHMTMATEVFLVLGMFLSPLSAIIMHCLYKVQHLYEDVNFFFQR